MHLFEINPEEVSLLNGTALVDIVNHILRAEASRSGITPVSLHLNLSVSEPDKGVDARVLPVSNHTSDWIPRGESVWQVKAGSLDPSDLREEFYKPGVQEVVQQGGYYCIANGEDYGDDRRQTRESTLKKCFKDAGLIPRYHFYTASALASWASELPAIVLLDSFNHPIGDLMRWKTWESQPVHSVRFETDPTREGFIQEIRRAEAGELIPIDIVGAAGVGKTRLALEAFRETLASERLLYAPQPEDLPLSLFSWLEVHPSYELILVVDECDHQKREWLKMQAERCGKRLFLITIGHSMSSYTSLPQGVLVLLRMSDHQIRSIVKQIAPQLHQPVLDHIVRVSGGFAKLATALATMIRKDPDSIGVARFVSTANLVRGYSIETVLETLLPKDIDRKVMRAIALLTRVGWDEDLAHEGEAVVKFLGASWPEAKMIAAKMERQGYVMKQGRYRYVTPELLAVWLALDVWEVRQNDIFQLIEDLPTIISRRAVIERLADLGDYEISRDFLTKILSEDGLFPGLDSLDDATRAKLLTTLASAAPGSVLGTLERILRHLPRDQLVEFRSGRRQIVWALEKLAWHEETFEGSARLLLRLAAAENEPYANNATAIWSRLFQTYLSGSSVPAIKRHMLLEEALENGDIEVRKLALNGIRSALSLGEMRDNEAEHQRGRLLPPEWQPDTLAEEQAVRRSALALLDRALTDPCEEIVSKAREILLRNTLGLIQRGLATEVITRLVNLQYERETDRREARRALKWILNNYSLTDTLRELVQSRIDELTGDTLHDHIRRWVRRPTDVDYRELQEQGLQIEDMVAQIAEEAFKEPEKLVPELEWLSSDEAHYFFIFGTRLGELDEERTLLPELVSRVEGRHGAGLLATYLHGRAVAGDKQWLDSTLDDWTNNRPELAYAVFEATWANDPGEVGASRIIQLIENGWIEPDVLGRLGYGKWIALLSAETFQTLLQLLLFAGSSVAHEAGLFLLMEWLKEHRADRQSIESVAWRLLESPSQLSNTVMGIFMWSQVAGIYGEDDPVRMAKIVLDDIESTEAPMLSEDPRLQALKNALIADTQVVWHWIGEFLLRDDIASYKFRLSIREWGIEAADGRVLLKWARSHQPEGPRILAELVVPLSSLARKILTEYETDEQIGQRIGAKFLSGSFWGSESSWLENKLAQAVKWTKGPDPAVVRWAQGVVDHLERRIRETRQEEEERGF